MWQSQDSPLNSYLAFDSEVMSLFDYYYINIIPTARFHLEIWRDTFTDLKCVLNGIWEVLEGTDRDGLLRWVLAGAVRLCEEGDDDLYVAFGAQSTWLQ